MSASHASPVRRGTRRVGWCAVMAWVVYGLIVGFAIGFTGSVFAQSDFSLQNEHRLSSVEVQMIEIARRLDALELLGRGVLVIVVGQLLVSGLNLKGRYRER